MARPDDEYPPLDVTSTHHLSSLEDVLDGSQDVGDDALQGRVAGSLPPGMALLVVRRGPNAGARFLLDRDVTTSGRHPDSDIFLDDITVSRRHVEIRRDGPRLTVSDVGSLNGTYLNRERIEQGDLVDGDTLQVGKFKLVYVAGPGDEPGAGGDDG